jgi:hypothetical protein
MSSFILRKRTAVADYADHAKKNGSRGLRGSREVILFFGDGDITEVHGTATRKPLPLLPQQKLFFA